MLKALESGAPEERLESVRMLVHTNLIKQSDVRKGVDEYITEKQKDPSTIPQSKPASAQALESPISENARNLFTVWQKRRTADFEALRNDLVAAGFAVVGPRSIVDHGRPDEPEVRYFDTVDKPQADNLAELMRVKFSDNRFSETLPGCQS